MGFTEKEILEILAKMRSQASSGEHQVIERLRNLSASTGGMVPQDQLSLVLTREGNLTQYDAGKVASFFSNRGLINVASFEDYLRQSLNI